MKFLVKDACGIEHEMDTENWGERFINIDCMEVLRRMPDKCADLCIVDPPYGVGSVTYMPCTRTTAHGGSFDKYEITIATLNMDQRKKTKVEVVHANNAPTTIKTFGDENISPPPEYFSELFRVSRHQIIWGGNYFMLPPSRGFVVWKKTTVAENFSMAMCEYAWMSLNENAKVFEGAPQGTATDKRVHPTQKPIALYKWLLTNYAKSGDRILDTHVGSASSLIACHQAGFKYWGFELDADYYKAATERLNKAKAQVDIFEAAEIPKPEQISIMGGD